MHLEKVLLFRLRSDESVNVGRSLGCRNKAGVIVSPEPYHVCKVGGHPCGATEKRKLVYRDKGIPKDFGPMRSLDMEIAKHFKLFHVVKLHPNPVLLLPGCELHRVL